MWTPSSFGKHSYKQRGESEAAACSQLSLDTEPAYSFLSWFRPKTARSSPSLSVPRPPSSWSASDEREGAERRNTPRFREWTRASRRRRFPPSQGSKPIPGAYPDVTPNTPESARRAWKMGHNSVELLSRTTTSPCARLRCATLSERQESKAMLKMTKPIKKKERKGYSKNH